VVVSTAGAVLVAAALAVALAGDWHEIEAAIGAVPIWVIVVVVVLQVAWLAVRSETWSVCICEAGGTVARRRLYPAASVGYLVNLLNGQLGLAVRIGALRRAAPEDSPRASVLAATEVPIAVVEIALAAIMSFTLVGPLGLPWWMPLVSLVAVLGIISALGRVAHRRREGVWSGLAVLRGMRGRNLVVALVVVAVCLQIGRNWFVLNAVGVEASVFDSVALLIGIAALGVLPVGPSVGAASAVIVFGSDGGAAAAAGAVLTATAAMAAICFAATAVLGSFRRPTPALAAG
jgi:hypothetical protein